MADIDDQAAQSLLRAIFDPAGYWEDRAHRAEEALAAQVEHLEGMADSLDEHVTHDDVHRLLIEALSMARAALGASGPTAEVAICEWCPSPASGSAWHNDGRLHPSCGQADHGAGWVPVSDR